MSNPPFVLIVDDDPDFVEIFSAKLVSSGFRVETAKDGAEALEKVKAGKPDVVLMDVQMPRVNGIQALLKLREDPAYAQTKVLFLTALGDPRFEAQEIHRRFSKEIGAEGYIRKGEDLDVIVERVRSCLS